MRKKIFIAIRRIFLIILIYVNVSCHEWGLVDIVNSKGSEKTSGNMNSVVNARYQYKGIFVTTGSMNSLRGGHTATLLNDGRVLIAGGTNVNNASGVMSSSEIYNPSPGVFAPGSSMNTVRYLHTATLLKDGRVLIVGGSNGTTALGSAEIFNPASGTFSLTGSLATARFYPAATLLPDGKVLITGGTPDSIAAFNSAEIYDPTTGLFTATAGLMNNARHNHTATLLNNGKVLVAGGMDSSYLMLNSAEIYDPATGTFTATGTMNAFRYTHTATLLNNGQVLISGGSDNNIAYASSEIFDAFTGIFTSTGSMSVARYHHSATMLNDGSLLIVGGANCSAGVTTTTYASSEIFYPATGMFSITGTLMGMRWGQTATLLSNSQVLITGGFNGTTYLASAELFQ